VKSLEQITEDVIRVIKDFLEDDSLDIRPTSLLEDSLDSLEVIEAGIYVEEKFDIEISDEAMVAWKTVEDVAKDVHAILAVRGPA